MSKSMSTRIFTKKLWLESLKEEDPSPRLKQEVTSFA
jgi:hypothetical protein